MTQNISVTKLKIHNHELLVTLDLHEKTENIQAELVFENPVVKLVHPVTCSSNGTVSIDTSALELNENDWTLRIRDLQTDTLYIPVLNGKVRTLLILGSSYIRRDDFIFFPMGGNGHQFVLRCRPWKSYDSFFTNLKELTAFGVYKLFGKIWKKKKIWLVFEKYSAAAQDNGFYFFQYCMENLSEAEKKHIYFILDKNSSQWSAISQYSQNVIPFMSFRHILYMLTAGLYIGSDSRAHAFAWKPQPNLISREINKKNIIFLQHGVTALKKVDHLFGKKGSSPMTYFVTTSNPEQDIVVNNFGYSRENAPIVGFTRWDVLNDKSSDSDRMILIMPTWRSWLENQSSDFFRQSDYYMNYMNLLNNEQFLSCLKENHTKTVFYIHPKLQEYLSSFHTDGRLVELIPFGKVPLNDLLMRCSMLITDYSSVSWDVYYQSKPVLFYQFDLKEYNETNGSYIDMETELFGDRCTDQPELIQLIREYMERGFREKEKYAEMRKKYFAYQDHNNCKRTYEYIKSQGY